MRIKKFLPFLDGAAALRGAGHRQRHARHQKR